MPAIHQLVAGFARGDAISNEALVLRSIFQKWGYESRIYCEQKRILPELRKEALDVYDFPFPGEPDDVAILHLSVGSPLNPMLPDMKCKKVILYHNVTPGHYFKNIQQQTARVLEKGREQTKALAGVADVVLADSEFNARELRDIGFGEVGILPLVLNFDSFCGEPDRKVIKTLDDGLCNILFVGRCAPNKKIEDLLVAFSMFQRHVEPNSRLIHVGSYAGLERYYFLLSGMARELKLRNTRMTGNVPQSHLNAYFQKADLFLCMSEHEGFCIPLIEAMANDIPVMAYSAAAVPETLGGAGVTFTDKNFPIIAEMMGHLTKDANLRQSVITKQRNRVESYKALDLESDLKRHLAPLLPTEK